MPAATDRARLDAQRAALLYARCQKSSAASSELQRRCWEGLPGGESAGLPRIAASFSTPAGHEPGPQPGSDSYLHAQDVPAGADSGPAHPEAPMQAATKERSEKLHDGRRVRRPGGTSVSARKPRKGSSRPDTAAVAHEYDAHAQAALAYYRSGQLDLSVMHSRRALLLRPDTRAYVNLGAALYELRDFQGAVNAFQGALAIDPDDTIARFNLANTLTEGHLFTAAIHEFQQVLELKPDWDEAFANMARNQETVCDWVKRSSRLGRLQEIVRLQLQRNVSSIVRPWHALAYPFPLSLLKAISTSVAAKTQAGVEALGAVPFSHRVESPFKKGIFRHHSKPRFHALCFALNVDDGGPERKRVEQDCETFASFHAQSASVIAKAVNDAGAHIAVNLDGWTSMGRTNDVFALTPAPLQVQYMGFPGTLGASYIPYLIADTVVAPPEYGPAYTEKMLFLPRSYYVNNYKDRFGESPAPFRLAENSKSANNTERLRKHHALPPHGKLFCNFNNLYKLSPDIFQTWTKVLDTVPESSLVLLSLPQDAIPNLQREAHIRIGNVSRLSFVPMVEKEIHLERAANCDVFLDTLLVNAHTVAMDVSWAALPLVTLPHERFSSRVAASVLRAAGCRGTISRTIQDYVSLARALGTSKMAARKVRLCLKRARIGSALFDTSSWVRDLEKLFRLLLDSSQIPSVSDVMFPLLHIVAAASTIL